MKTSDIPLLELREITKCYGTGETMVTAVSKASAALYGGQVVALLGPSGSGKSTLLLIAGLLEEPTSGTVLIQGKIASGPHAEIVDARGFRRQHVGFVFQKPNLIGFLTAAENVCLAMEINDVAPRDAAERTAELLKYLGVEHRSENLPAQLSGGEQQRVAIARALANKPLLVLADEPTAALDSKRGRQVVGLFKRAAQDMGAAVLLVTHDHRCLDLVDRILEIEDGTLRERSVASFIAQAETTSAGGTAPAAS